MNALHKLILIVLFMVMLMGIPTTNHAAGIKKIAQTGMKWLSIPIGARGNGMGGAYTAIANDASSLFWNPAGIAYVDGNSFFLNQTKWIADVAVNAAVITYNTGNLGVFGLSFIGVNWGNIPGTVRTNTSEGYLETGNFSPTNYSVGLGYARTVSNRFAFGGHIKYIYEKLGSTQIGTFDSPDTYTAEMGLLAIDFGTIYHTGYKDLKLAMSFQNFSTEEQYRAEAFPLPLNFKFGVAMDILKIWSDPDKHALIVSVEALHPRDYTERVHMGMEYGFSQIFYLRGGYKTNYDEEDLSFGFGLKYGLLGLDLAIDYAYMQFKSFDSVHTFSFNLNF